jgi:peptide/nickel transport system substrate-binding protein
MEMPTWVLYWIDLSDLITRYWQQVGVKATLKPEDPGLWTLRMQSGEADGTFCGCGDDDGMLLSYREYVPIRQEWGFAFAAPLWALWHQTSGKSGEEPPPEIKKVLELYDEIVVTTDQKKQVELAREIIRINAENFWFGATSRRPGKGVVIKNNVRNVPEYVRGISSLDLAPTNSCQYFFKR